MSCQESGDGAILTRKKSQINPEKSQKMADFKWKICYKIIEKTWVGAYNGKGSGIIWYMS